MAKSSTPKMTWHFFLPALAGGIITWIFSMNVVLAAEVFVVVLVVEYIARMLEKK